MAHTSSIFKVLLCVLVFADYSWNVGYAASRNFTAPTPPDGVTCFCPGDQLNYTCTNVGGFATIFNGTALVNNCSITLCHSAQFQPPQGQCNGGSIVGRAVSVTNDSVENCYTSELLVTASSDLNGRTVSCVRGITLTVGSYTLQIAGPPLPPTNIMATEISQSSFTVTWTPLTNQCGSTLTYQISSTDCGTCTVNTGTPSASCTNWTPSGQNCTVRVRAVSNLCGGLTGAFSDSLTVTLRATLEVLVNSTVNETTIGMLISEVSQIANISANGNISQTPDILTGISTVFGNVANFINSANITINATVVSDMVFTLNSLLRWDPDFLVVNSTSSLLQSFENVASLFAQQTNLVVDLTDVSFVAKLAPTDNFRARGSFVDFESQVGSPASIILPPSLFNLVPEDWQFIGIFFTLYKVPALFPITNQTCTDNMTTRMQVVGSPVVGATVGPGITFININPSVLITLGLQNPENISQGSERCVSWDFNSRSWVMEGCSTKRVGNNVECRCNHLTNFAVLVDICSRAQDCVSNPILDMVLDRITLIGVVVSSVGLVITIITLLAFKKLREKDNSKYHIQLSIAILCLLIVFAAGIDKVQVYGGCIVVSILIHYFSLTAVMWMGAEALLMFQKLAIVFMQITKTYIVILSFVCWLVPLIPVLIPMIVDLADGTTPETDLIITRNVDNETGIVTGFCFHKHPGVFFGAFLGPTFTIILFNTVIFIWVIVILIKHTRGQLKHSKQNLKPKTVIRLVISMSGVMFLFGLTWLFGALTFSIAGNIVLRDVFRALFVIFASFQGFFIFLFFCVCNKEALESWKEVLSCGKYKSPALHPSQARVSSGVASHQKSSTVTTKASSTLDRTTYQSDATDRPKFDVKDPPLSEKQDLPKVDYVRYSELSLQTGDQVSTITTELTSVEANTCLDMEDEGNRDKITENNDGKWYGVEPLLKARVNRHSTKKVQKHHIEKVEIDFLSDGSDTENA